VVGELHGGVGKKRGGRGLARDEGGGRRPTKVSAPALWGAACRRDSTRRDRAASRSSLWVEMGDVVAEMAGR
jgi:hypothetical protein